MQRQLTFAKSHSSRCSRGGISTPASALAAFMWAPLMWRKWKCESACVEAGTSACQEVAASGRVTRMWMGAPASDMLRWVSELQVLEAGTTIRAQEPRKINLVLQKRMNPLMKSQQRNASLEKKYQKTMEKFASCIEFFKQRDPEQIRTAPKTIRAGRWPWFFRWYLGLSPTWPNAGTPDRVLDVFKFWCGPALGAFNDWVKGTYLEHYRK